MGANIRAKRDLASLCEVEDINTEVFIRTAFAYVDDYDRVWFGQTNDKIKYDLTVNDLNHLLQPISDERIYPVETGTIQAVSAVKREDLYIKRPKLLCLGSKEQTKLLPRMLIEEEEVLRFFQQHPHPNLIKFHGCTVNRGRMIDIALEKYGIILQYRHEDVPYPLDIDACRHKIREGVKHMHSLEFVYDDLNTTNVLLDSNENPVVIDFGYCKRPGEELLSGGTHGWIDEDYSTSVQNHDESALDKIDKWLRSITLGD